MSSKMIEVVENVKVTLKERDFILAYLNDAETRGNATASFLKTQKGAKELTQSSAYSEACRFLGRPHVKKTINALLQIELTPDWVLGKLRKEADDNKNKGADRIRATELVGKTMAMFAEKTETVVRMEGILLEDSETFE